MVLNNIGKLSKSHVRDQAVWSGPDDSIFAPWQQGKHGAGMKFNVGQYILHEISRSALFSSPDGSFANGAALSMQKYLYRVLSSVIKAVYVSFSGGDAWLSA